jgi:hypothetical protein
VRNSGPLVVIVSGDVIPDDAHRLLESVHYEADMTAIPQPEESDVEKTSKLLLGIAVLSLIGATAAILLGGIPGRGQGALPHCDEANRPRRSTTWSSFISICRKNGSKSEKNRWKKSKQLRGRIRRVNVVLILWKNGPKPEEN